MNFKNALVLILVVLNTYKHATTSHTSSKNLFKPNHSEFFLKFRAK